MNLRAEFEFYLRSSKHYQYDIESCNTELDEIFRAVAPTLSEIRYGFQ